MGIAINHVINVGVVPLCLPLDPGQPRGYCPYGYFIYKKSAQMGIAHPTYLPSLSSTSNLKPNN
jgi:hypothetical protein